MSSLAKDSSFLCSLALRLRYPRLWAHQCASSPSSSCSRLQRHQTRRISWDRIMLFNIHAGVPIRSQLSSQSRYLETIPILQLRTREYSDRTNRSPHSFLDLEPGQLSSQIHRSKTAPLPQTRAEGCLETAHLPQIRAQDCLGQLIILQRSRFPAKIQL